MYHLRYPFCFVIYVTTAVAFALFAYLGPTIILICYRVYVQYMYIGPTPFLAYQLLPHSCLDSLYFIVILMLTVDPVVS